MTQNFGSNFLRGFQPNFANMFETSYRRAGIEDEREQQRQEKEKARQQQLGILSQLFKGTKNVPMFQNNRVPLMDAGQSFTNKEVPLSSQEQFDLRAQLSPSSALSFLDSMNKPQQDEYYAPIIGKENKTILRYNKTKSVLEDTQQPNPLYKEDVPSTFDVVPANSIKGYEHYPSDYTVQIHKKGDEVIGQTLPSSPKQLSVNINNGEETYKIGKETKDYLDSKVKELNTLKGLLSHAPDDNGKYRIYDKMGQDTGIRYTPDQVQKAINDKNAEMGSYLEGNFGQSLSDYNNYKSKTSNPVALWDTVYQNYIRDTKDDKDDAWFEAQRYAFIKDYGFDPAEKFNQRLFNKKK